MVLAANRTNVRQHDRPEVWQIRDGARHWIPDTETLGTLGGWGSVTVLPAGEVVENPMGAMVQSVIHPYKWDDGSLIAAWPDPHVYAMTGGTRRWITSPDVMAQRGYDWSSIQPISSVEMNAIPEGPPDWGNVPPAQLVVHTGRQFLGAGHYMETNAMFTRATGETTGGTTTETVTWFGGYHGAVYAVLTGQYDIPVPGGQSPVYRYGVDGTAIGTSKRFDGWSFTLDPTRTAAVNNLHIFHIWAPDQFQAILDNWVAAGKSVAELAKDVAAIAAVVAAVAA